MNARPPETASVELGLMDLAKLADFLVTSSNLATLRLATSVQTHSLLIMLDCICIVTRGGIHGEIKPES